MTAHEWLTVILIGAGIFFKLVAAIGLNRMPDLYSRMHGAAKSTTLGVTFILLAVAVYFGTPTAITKAILVVLFFFLTAPVGVHILARAAYFRGVARWEGTVLDELADRYDPRSHELR
jgi:multicomponent Na+:H+ antiporter subunit G